MIWKPIFLACGLLMAGDTPGARSALRLQQQTELNAVLPLCLNALRVESAGGSFFDTIDQAARTMPRARVRQLCMAVRVGIVIGAIGSMREPMRVNPRRGGTV